MFHRHVTKDLSAYCHSELTPNKLRRVAEHLLRCERCRREYEDIKLGDQLAKQLPLVSAPASLWSEIETLLEATSHPAATRPADIVKPKHPWLACAFTGPRFTAASAALVLLLFGCVAAWYYTQRPSQPAWEVASLMGAPIVDSQRITQNGRLSVGEWVETDAGSRSRIEVADIVHVEIDPQTRVLLVGTGST